MFEIGIFCVILFVIGYWTTLFVMGRREDVLHGQFVKVEPELTPFPAGAPVPLESTLDGTPQPTPVAAMVETASAVPASVPVAEAALVPRPKAVPAQPLAAKTSGNAVQLQSLLASIKQELKNAAQL